MKAHGIRRALAAIVAYVVSALTPKVPRTPAVIKFNEHAFAKRVYGKVVAGGRGIHDTIRGVIRGVLGTARSIVSFLKPAAALAALLAVMLAINATAGGDGTLLANGIGVAFSAKGLREAKAALVRKSRETIEAAQKREQAIEERADATQADKDEARANTERAKSEARALLEQAKDLDPDIELAEEQEAQEAHLGRSQGRLAGGRDTDTDPPPNRGQASDDGFADLTVEERGLAVGRVVRALAAGRGDLDKAMAHASKHWGEDDVAFRALSSSDEVAGGAVVPDALAASIIELLRPMSAIRSLNPTIIPMGSGSLRLPKLAGGAAAEYIGENDNANKTEQTFGLLNLVFKKLSALVPISNDLMRYATPNVDQLVRDDVGSALAQKSDGKFIRGLGTEHSPKGLRYWAPAANVIGANATVNLTNVTTDLGKLVLALENANVRMLRPGWVFSPRTKHYLMTVRDGNGNFAFRDEMMQGRLWDFPFQSTTQVPSNLGGGGDESEVYLADFADAVIGEALNMLLDASREAAYHDGAQIQAAFSRDQTVVRALQEHDFGMRHEESVAVLNEVTWGA